MKTNHDMDQIRRYIMDFRVRPGIELSLFSREKPKTQENPEHARSVMVMNQLDELGGIRTDDETILDEETGAPMIRFLRPGRFMELRVRGDDDGALTWFNLAMNGSWYALAMNAPLEANCSRWLTIKRGELAAEQKDSGDFFEDGIMADAVSQSERMVAFLTPKNFDWDFEELSPDDIEGNFVKVKRAIDRLVETFGEDWTWGWLEVEVRGEAP